MKWGRVAQSIGILDNYILYPTHPQANILPWNTENRTNMSHCKPEIILQRDDFVLTRCHQCQRVGMMYGQCMLSFNSKNFNGFCRYLEELQFEDDHKPFYDGIDRIIIESYHQNIQFALKEEEFYQLKDFLLEAHLQLQVQEILNKH